MASKPAWIRQRAERIYADLDEDQRRAVHGAVVLKPRVTMISGPAGAGKSKLLAMFVLLLDIGVAVPTNGARRSGQDVVDAVLPRRSCLPELEVLTTYTHWGVGMGENWDADAISEAINQGHRQKMKARAMYGKEVCALDEAAQTWLLQLDTAACVGPRVNGGFQQRFILILDGVQTPPVVEAGSAEALVSAAMDPASEMIWESRTVMDAEREGELRMYGLRRNYRAGTEKLKQLGQALRDEDFEAAFPLVVECTEVVTDHTFKDIVHDNDEAYPIADMKHGGYEGATEVYARRIGGYGAQLGAIPWHWSDQRNMRRQIRAKSRMLLKMHVYPGQLLVYEPIGGAGAVTDPFRPGGKGWYLKKGELMEVMFYDAASRQLRVRCPKLASPGRAAPCAWISDEKVWVQLDGVGAVQLAGIPARYEDIETVYSSQVSGTPDAARSDLRRVRFECAFPHCECCAVCVCWQGSQSDNVHLHIQQFKGCRNLLYTGATRAKQLLKISGLKVNDDGDDLREKMKLHPKSVLWQMKLGVGNFSAERVAEAQLEVEQARVRARDAGAGALAP